MAPSITSRSTLSSRGSALASGPNMRDLASKILTKQWHPVTNPDGLVNLGTAENYLMLDDVAKFVKSQDLNLQGDDFNYGEGPWGSVRLRTAMANFINSHFSPTTPLKPGELTLTNGCSSLFNMLGHVLGDGAGDGILLTMPSYVAFQSDFGLLAKMTPIFVPFAGVDQFAPESLSCYEAARQKAEEQGVRIRALMLCNPHNPLGRCYPASTLTALLKFCAQHKIHLLADEIYAMSVYSTPSSPSSSSSCVPFTSILSLPWTQYISPDYLHHVYGLSKDFASGGLRIGSLWTQNAELQRAVSAIAMFHWSGTVNDVLAATILGDSDFVDSFLEKSRKRLADANALARKVLDEAGICYAPGTNAGFYLWIDLSPWLREEGGEDGWEREGKLAERLLKEKLFLTGGGMQAAEQPGWFRLVFSNKEVVLKEGLKRLRKVLDGK